MEGRGRPSAHHGCTASGIEPVSPAQPPPADAKIDNKHSVHSLAMYCVGTAQINHMMRTIEPGLLTAALELLQKWKQGALTADFLKVGQDKVRDDFPESPLTPGGLWLAQLSQCKAHRYELVLVGDTTSAAVL